MSTENVGTKTRLMTEGDLKITTGGSFYRVMRHRTVIRKFSKELYTYREVYIWREGYVKGINAHRLVK